MAEPETDGIAEVFDDGTRLAITAAGRPAEQRIRERERQLREAQAESDQTARELQGRIDGAAAFGLAEWLSVMAVSCRLSEPSAAILALRARSYLVGQA